MVEIASPRHVLGVIEGRCRADRILLEFRQAVAAAKRVGDLDRFRRLPFEDGQLPRWRGCWGRNGGEGSRRLWDRLRLPRAHALTGQRGEGRQHHYNEKPEQLWGEAPDQVGWMCVTSRKSHYPVPRIVSLAS